MNLLQTKGNKIVDSTGKTVYLRGTCIGGWMNLEDFINAYPGAESTIRKRIKEVLGASKGEYFFSKMIDNFLTEEDVKFIAETGATCVRLPLNYRHFESDDDPFNYKEEGFKRLESIVSLFEKYGVYVILDMHAVPGWQNSHWHCDNERGASLFWTHKQFQDRLLALWQEIARRYKGRGVVAGYELMNEPATSTPNGDHPFDFFENYKPDWEIMNKVYRRLVEGIREVDSEHIIFMEGDRYGRFFSGLDAPFAPNLVYSSHNYTQPGFGPGPYPGHYGSEGTETYWDKNRHFREFYNHEGPTFCRKHNVPLLVGEFGSQYHGDPEQIPDRLRYMDDQISVYNENNVNWTTWTYKDAGVMGWVTLDPESEYMQIVKPVQRMKRTLGAENFVAMYTACPGREKSRELADLILQVSGEPFNPVSNAQGLNYAALTGYAAAILQPAYAKRFQGISEDDIDRIMSSFHFKNCVINKDYIAILKKHLSCNSAEK